MKILYLLAALILITLSPVFLGLGAFTAVSTDWVPSRTISAFELKRVEIAKVFVEEQTKRLNRVPTYAEFDNWKEHAATELRVEGQGFDYWEVRGHYFFSWWDGDASVSWHPEQDPLKVLISPENVFVFGSKLRDLTVFLGTGTIMLAVAFWLALIGQRNDAHES